MTLFITVGGGIKLHYAPMAFGLTSMGGDSTSNSQQKFAGLLGMLLLMSTRARGILSVCLNARFFLVLPVFAFASVFWFAIPSQTLCRPQPSADHSFLLFISTYASWRRADFVSDGCGCDCGSGVCVRRRFFPRHRHRLVPQDAWRGVFSSKEQLRCDLCLLSRRRTHYALSHLAGLASARDCPFFSPCYSS